MLTALFSNKIDYEVINILFSNRECLVEVNWSLGDSESSNSGFQACFLSESVYLYVSIYLKKYSICPS